MRTHCTAAALTLLLAAPLAGGCEGPAAEGPLTRGDGSDRSDDSEGKTDSAGSTDAVDGFHADGILEAPGTGDDGGDTGDGYGDGPSESEELGPEWQSRLDEREPDYGAALRAASLRLRGDLPSRAEIELVANAPDPRDAYERSIDGFLEDPRFVRRMLDFWRDTLKMGGRPELEAAPVFATQLVVEDRPFIQLFTAPSGNCPTFDPETNEFTPGTCENGAPAQAGVLTNTGVMEHFFSNLAFRRVRWVQETFVCKAFPAEFDEPEDVGGDAPYTSPWAFESIAGADTGGRIDFHDTSSVICANCHSTMNHIAPLFGRFDAEGQWQEDFAVTLPLEDLPTAQLSDWLPEGETTAWRHGVPAANLSALGAALAADPDVHACMVARLWNWALGKGDIVKNRATVPDEITQPIVEDWIAGGFRMKDVVRTVFTSEDFVRY